MLWLHRSLGAPLSPFQTVPVIRHRYTKYARIVVPLLERRIRTGAAYDGHIPLNRFENAFLAVGSAFMALSDPRRGGEILWLNFY
jgi:ubiquinone biosynthesis protein COQ4